MWCDYGSWGFTCPWDFHNTRKNNWFNAPSGPIEPDNQTTSHNLSSSLLCTHPKQLMVCYKPSQQWSDIILSVVSVGELIIHEICDRIWENPPYAIRARFAQCAFLVAQVQICQSPDFVISMSNNPSSNCSRRLRRLVVSYKGEISLHFDPPSLYSCRVRSPLLREIIRIRARGLSRYS